MGLCPQTIERARREEVVSLRRVVHALNRMPSSVGYAELSTMDWDDIRFFLGVARAEQFSAAAARMGVDTATVARRINALEKSLNARLLNRRQPACALSEGGGGFSQIAKH